MRFRLAWPWRFEQVVRTDFKADGTKEELKLHDLTPARVRRQVKKYREAAAQVGL